MKVTSRECVFTGKYLCLVNKHFQTVSGEGIWETVVRTNVHEGAVVIVALTKDGEIILERNWRVPLESYVIQFPAGLTDKEGETTEETARRELLEETGYLAKKLISIIDAPEYPVLTPMKSSHFLARDVEYVGKEKPDLAEQIEVIKIPLGKLKDFLLNLPADTALDLRVPGLLWILEKQKMI